MNIHSMRSNRFVSKEYVRSTADITSADAVQSDRANPLFLGGGGCSFLSSPQFFLFFVVAAGGKNVPSFLSTEK